MIINKKAFTLFEVLVSLVIISIIFISFSKLYISKNNIEVYYELQKIENNYIEHETVISTEDIKFSSIQ